MPTPSFVLKSIALRAFRSVVEEQTLALPTTGMHLILGPSGAGKSTLAEAVAHGLGFSTISATALQSWDWLTNDSLLDIVEVETAKGLLRVRRGKQASILMPGEEKPRTSAKAVGEGVVSALGLKPEFLSALTYRAQKTPGKFLSMRDSEKKSFLTTLLGAETFEVAAEKSVQASSTLQAEVDRAKVRAQTLAGTVPPEPVRPEPPDLAGLKQRVVETDAEVAKVEEALAGAKKLDVELTTHMVRRVADVRAEWQPKVDAARVAAESVPQPDIAGWQAKLNAVTTEQAKLVREHRAEVAVVEKELETTRTLYIGLKGMADKKAAAEQTLTQAKKDLAALEGQTCFTCGQTWKQNIKAWTAKKVEYDVAEKTIADAAAAAAQLPMLEASGKDLKSKLADMKAKDPVPSRLLDEEREARTAITSAKAQRDAQVANLRAEAYKLSSEMERALQAANRMSPEEEGIRRAVGDIQQALGVVGARRTQAKMAVQAAEREYQQALSFFDRQRDAYDRAVVTVREAEGAVRTSEAALAREQDFLGEVRGFLGYIFDETLCRIADRTNARLALIPNVSGLTLRFTSERETGTGKLRQEITAVCEKNGHTIPLKDGISGGMYSAVELAVDLSVADVIAERTGVYPGWLFLDECFEGLDAPCKTACFDMLRELSKERAVFVVDHANEMKELFDSRIEMRFDGEKTRIHINGL